MDISIKNTAGASRSRTDSLPKSIFVRNSKKMNKITLKDYLTASGKYPSRETHPEVTPEIKAAAEKLLIKVNALLDDLGIEKRKVSSGFRPSAVNAATPNAAKKSLHMTGHAVDLEDPTGEIDAKIEARDDLKKKYGLWQESPAATKNWAHLDDKDRGPRPKNTFIP